MNKQEGPLLGDSKLHYKMYKSGKRWLFAAMCVVGIGAGAGSLAHVQAATTTPGDSTGATPASDTTDGSTTTSSKTVALQSSKTSTSSTQTANAASKTADGADAKSTTQPAITAGKQATKTVATDAKHVSTTAATTTATGATVTTTVANQTPAKQTPAQAGNTTLPQNLPAGVTASFGADGTLNIVIPAGDTAAKAEVEAAIAGKGYKAVNITQSGAAQNSDQDQGFKQNTTGKSGDAAQDAAGTITVTKDDFEQFFALNGNPNAATYDPTTGIVTLTTDDNNQSGNVTLKNQITTDHSFQLTGTINLGDKSQEEGGADGISFGFHAGGDTTAVGQNGGSLGFAGLPNAFGWKADTYWDQTGINLDAGYFDADPSEFDPSGQLQQGVSFGAFLHTELVDGKLKAITTDPADSKDPAKAQQIPEPNGQFTDFEIDYDAQTKQMTVKYGDQTWMQDVTQLLGSSDSKLNFFVAGSTGGMKNQQQFRFDTLTYAPSAVVAISYVDDDNNGAEIPSAPVNQLKHDVGYVENDVPTVIAAENSAITALGYVNKGTTIGDGTQYDPNSPSSSLTFTNVPGSIVVHYKHATSSESDTVNKVVHYVNEGGDTLAGDYKSTVTFTATTDAVTGNVTYTGNQTLTHQDNPTVKGYTVKTSPNEATSDQNVALGAQNEDYTVVYAKDAPTVTSSTVTKTVHYVDEAGNTLADDFTDTVTFTSSKDAVTDAVTTTQDKPALGHQADPTIKGYTVKTSPAEATSDQNVALGAQNEDYTVVYAKDAPMVTSSTVTKTVHYVDEAGKTLAHDFTDTVTFTSSKDAVTDAITTTQDKPALGHQNNPIIKGYTVKTSPAEATSDQNVALGAQNEDYTVVYSKNPPTITTTTVTKTVHYVDEEGKTLAGDFTDTVTFTSSKDAVTDAVTTTQDKPALGHQADPTVKGYTVKTSPAEATSDQNVALGAQNEDYTVIYSKNPPTILAEHTTTKTVHYIDEYGKQLAPDFTDSVTFTKLQDAATDAISYTATANHFGHQNNPAVANYQVIISPTAATSDQPAQYDSTNQEFTVIYAKDAPKVLNQYTATKTVHYITEAGQQVAPDFTDSVTFTKLQDPVTGAISYTQTNPYFGHQANPAAQNYQVVISPAAATSNQNVEYGTTDQEYTVIYAKKAPKVLKQYTATKIVHYVDVAGKTLAPDYYQSITFTKLQDPVTKEISYTATNPIFSHQDNPSIPGYFVTSSPYAATRDQNAQYGDTNQEYTVIYAVPSTSTDNVPPTQPSQPTTGDGRDQTPPDLPDTFGGPDQPDLPDTFGGPDLPGTPQDQLLADTYGESGRRVNSAAKEVAAKSATNNGRVNAAKSQLPQTGDHSQSGLVFAGLALVLGALGMAGFRKREN